MYNFNCTTYSWRCKVEIDMTEPPPSRPRAASRKKPARRPGERAGLALPLVLDRARTIAAAEGVESLTMRRLAQALGVAPNALYSHFEDKTALLDALLDAVLADVEIPVIDNRGAAFWHRGLLDLMRASRRVLLAHPDLVPLFLSRPTRGPNAVRLGELTLDLLARGGVRGPAAVDALRILLIYTFGFAAQEAPRRAEPHPEERAARSQAAFENAPEAPRMRELARPLARHPDDQTFERGLRWILAGIAQSGGHGS